SLYTDLLFSSNPCFAGDKARPFLTTIRTSSSLSHIPPPVPPKVNAGLTITGYFIELAKSTAASTVLTISLAGTGSFNSSIKLRNNSRSEEHTSELQSRFDLVCRLLLDKKNAKM